MQKRFLRIIVLCFTIIALLSTNVSASGINEEEVSDLFTSFLDRVMDGSNDIVVVDPNGNDKTEEFMNFANKLYKIQDYKSIQDYISENGLEVSIVTTKDINTVQRDFSTMNISSKNVTREFYVTGRSDRTYSKTAEWVMRLSGNFSYDTSTNRITSVTKPVLQYAHGTFGASYAPFITNVTTSGSYSGSVATFTGKYTMMATETIRLVTVDHNFGTYTHTVSGGPLQ